VTITPAQADWLNASGDRIAQPESVNKATKPVV